MTESIQDQYRRGLAKYSEDLLESTAARATRFTRSKRSGDAVEQIVRTLRNEKAVSKMIADLSRPQQATLSILRRACRIPMRWDHAVRILSCLGIESPYPVLQELLSAGLLWMQKPASQEPLVRYEVPDGLPPELLPTISLSAPLFEQTLSLPETKCPLPSSKATGAWRSADGWEWPIRLAVLWQASWLAPIKRTQQRQLFKKDRERLTGSGILSAETLDSLAKIPEAGLLVYHLAQDQGWLNPSEDEQSPQAPLWQVWPDELVDVLVQCGRGLVTADVWNELGPDAPVGSFATDMASARFLCLYWLGQVESTHGVLVEEIAANLERVHPAWGGGAEAPATLRNGRDRGRLCRTWTRAFLLGAAYQCGLIEAADADREDAKVRLSSIGRRLLDLPATISAAERHPQTLLVQPNHQIVVFRQGLSIDLLTHLVLFAEPRSAGAALTFELTPASVYHGLEAGLSTSRMLEILTRGGGRAIPAGVQQSIETWSQKRERLTIYEDVSLFEFSTPSDMADAIAKGLEGEAVSDRILLVEQPDGAFKNLRITASRDYRLPPQPCVEACPDGVTLRVDLEKSDLMLESELLRFAEALDFSDRDGRTLFRVTRESLESAFDLGWRIESVEQWFRQRTGSDPPASVRLLLRALSGLKLEARPMLVLSAESPLVADGLLQHPRTSELIARRIGPSALVVEERNLRELVTALGELGIDVEAIGLGPFPEGSVESGLGATLDR